MKQRRHAAVSIAILAGCLVVAALDLGARGIGTHCALGALGGQGACPGCGLTRATTLAVHGEWRAAWAMHPAGPLVAVLCLAGILVHLATLLRGRRTDGERRLLKTGRWIFVAGVFAGWLLH